MLADSVKKHRSWAAAVMLVMATIITVSSASYVAEQIEITGQLYCSPTSQPNIKLTLLPTINLDGTIPEFTVGGEISDPGEEWTTDPSNNYRFTWGTSLYVNNDMQSSHDVNGNLVFNEMFGTDTPLMCLDVNKLTLYFKLIHIIDSSAEHCSFNYISVGPFCTWVDPPMAPPMAPPLAPPVAPPMAPSCKYPTYRYPVVIWDDNNPQIVAMATIQPQYGGVAITIRGNSFSIIQVEMYIGSVQPSCDPNMVNYFKNDSMSPTQSYESQIGCGISNMNPSEKFI